MPPQAPVGALEAPSAGPAGPLAAGPVAGAAAGAVAGLAADPVAGAAAGAVGGRGALSSAPATGDPALGWVVAVLDSEVAAPAAITGRSLSGRGDEARSIIA